jgi:hypothetical protein
VTYDDWKCTPPDNDGPPCDECGTELPFRWFNNRICEDCAIEIDADEIADEELIDQWPEGSE